MQNLIIENTIHPILATSKQYVALTNWAVIKISGINAQDFLQGQFTCDVSLVNKEQATKSALCNHQGRVIAIFYLLKKEEDYLCVLPGSISDQFIKHLSKFAVFSKVILEDITKQYCIYGCLGENYQKTSPYSLVYEENTVFCSIPGVWPRCLILSEKAYHYELDKEDFNWKLISICSGEATVYPQTIGTFTVHMLNLHLGSAVSFNKGCYVGQEIIARTQYLGKSKRHLCQARIDSCVTLQPGQAIYAQDAEVGLLVDSVIIDTVTYVLAVLQDPIDQALTINNQLLQDTVSFSNVHVP